MEWLFRRRPEHVDPGEIEETPQRPAYESPYLDSDRWAELLVMDDDRLPVRADFQHGFLVEHTTQKFVNVGNRHLQGLGIWSCRVRGESYYRGEIWPGRAVTLVREPDNPNDSNAIAILDAQGEKLGYWNKGMAPALAKLLDAGEPIEAVALDRKPPKVIAGHPDVMRQLR